MRSTTKRETARPIGAIEGLWPAVQAVWRVRMVTCRRLPGRQATDGVSAARCSSGGFRSGGHRRRHCSDRCRIPWLRCASLFNSSLIGYHRYGRQQTPEYGWISTYNDFTIVRPTVKIKDSRNGAGFCARVISGADAPGEQCVKLFGCGGFRDSGRSVAGAESEVLDVVDGLIEQLCDVVVVEPVHDIATGPVAGHEAQRPQ